MSKEYAFNVIQDIYDEGERDYVFLENIMGLIAHDEFDNPREMDADEIFLDATRLVRFLLDSGDFKLFRASNEGGQGISYEICKGEFVEIENMMRDVERKTGQANFFEYQFVLRKVKKGAIVSAIPNEILELWNAKD